MISKITSGYGVRRAESHWVIFFGAMASPCEILVRHDDINEVERLASLAYAETHRIEKKFSRYRNDNIIYAINTSLGRSIEVDEELARLLTYADQCYRLSEGLFDITSGVLRRAWKFDCSPLVPDEDVIEKLKAKVGWEKVEWDGKHIRLQPEMEIDLGGIGKEYAVDIVAEMLARETDASLMVNFGGDIRAMSPGNKQEPWIVGIEDPDHNDSAIGEIRLSDGGLATSGDARRYCLVEGVRLGHILNPRTGWPVAGGPRSVTVVGNLCVEAGFLATLAMLQGELAEEFLRKQGVTYHCAW